MEIYAVHFYDGQIHSYWMTRAKAQIMSGSIPRSYVVAWTVNE